MKGIVHFSSRKEIVLRLGLYIVLVTLAVVLLAPGKAPVCMTPPCAADCPI